MMDEQSIEEWTLRFNEATEQMKQKDVHRWHSCIRCESELTDFNTLWQESLHIKHIVECDGCAGSGAIY